MMRQNNIPDGRATRYRLVASAILILCLLLIYWLKPTALLKTVHLLSAGDISGTIDFIRSYGPYAAFVSFGIVILINIVAVLPNIFLLAANGIIFGVIEGTILSWAAESVGVIISFVLMRYVFRDSAHKVIVKSNALKRLDVLSGKDGLKIMLIARSIPFLPSGLITALGALSSIRAVDYVLATLIGKLPSAWIEVTVGHDLASYHQHMARLTFLVLISLAAMFFWKKNKDIDEA